MQVKEKIRTRSGLNFDFDLVSNRFPHLDLVFNLYKLREVSLKQKYFQYSQLSFP